MKRTLSFFFPPALAFAGVIVCCAILWNQTARFKRSVEKIAEDVRVSLIDLNGKVVYDSAGNDLGASATTCCALPFHTRR